MSISYRELKSEEDLRACIALQQEIWGLDPINVTSLITLKAVSVDHPRLGLLMGAFDGDRLVAFSLALGSMKPRTAYGYMLGVADEYRDRGVGLGIHTASFKRLDELGVERMLWTYEPLEGRNANLYFNRVGGRVRQYLKAHYSAPAAMHQGMPQDRFVFEARVGVPVSQTDLSLSVALNHYPVAGGRAWPEDDVLLVQIPDDLQALKSKDMEAALQWRMRTREIFEEYLNRRGYEVSAFLTGKENLTRLNYYLLRVPEGE